MVFKHEVWNRGWGLEDFLGTTFSKVTIFAKIIPWFLKWSNAQFVAFAKNEVILSAGAIANPQLLMLSGIGPADHLKYHNIPLIHDLPGVGQNMQSHVGMGELIFTVKKPVTFNPVKLSMNPFNFINYFMNGNGPLASASGLEAIGKKSLNKHFMHMFRYYS